MSTMTTHVLLVEDDESDALLVRRFLEASPDGNFEIQVVDRAVAAMTQLKRGGIDLVILDLGLPDSDGLDLLLRIRNTFPGLPVVVLSGMDDEALALRAVERGAQDYVAKGLVAGQLLYRAVRFAIARQKQVRHYKAEACTDPLTGLPNRRVFDSEIDRCSAEGKRYGKPFSLFLIDIDHFKKLNDTFGHRAGDYVLCIVGSVLSESFREVDVVSRIGGEEFAVLMPNTALDDGKMVANRVLKAIADAEPNFDNQAMKTTASGGVVEGAQAEDVESLIGLADQCLYAAKEAGRNRAHFWDGHGPREIVTPEPCQTVASVD